MPLIIDGVSGTIWGTKLRKSITLVCGLIAAVTSAVVGVAKAAPIIEPYWFASHSFVREIADMKADKESSVKVERVLHHIQIEQAEGKREAAEADLFKAGLEMKKAADDDTRQYIQQQINRLSATKERLNQQINTLSTIKSD